MNIINLTPHQINFIDGTFLPASGIVARCEEITEKTSLYVFTKEMILAQNNEIHKNNIIPIKRKSWGKVNNLPEEKENIYYVVSALVANACPNRTDLLCPQTIKTKKGILCKALIIKKGDK